MNITFFKYQVFLFEIYDFLNHTQQQTNTKNSNENFFIVRKTPVGDKTRSLSQTYVQFENI